MSQFDPNAAASQESGIFGLNDSFESAALIFLPIPWEATTSYGGGTSGGPKAILRASRQVDLFDAEVLNPYEAGFYLLPESREIKTWNQKAKKEAQKIIKRGGEIGNNRELKKSLQIVNSLGEKLNQLVFSETQKLLKSQKRIGLIGGDHSVPFGALKAVAEHYPSFGILHFDAHSDTRIAFEGFTWSHASIMYNVLEKIPQVKKLVQVGIRDYCEQEYKYCKQQGNRVSVFYDQELSGSKFAGTSWKEICEKIIEQLPNEVWISFDIDGLDPRFCPNTGTPVPGGLDFNEAVFVISSLVRSGRKIIGFDLNEVAPSTNKNDSWDANVGARLLYKVSGLMMASQGLRKLRK
ncbi:MAG: agmatinase family protein [Deltaproteobacteria bacterium]|nr:agmatinase family protein [Deltaproteobacteria bacterium]